MKLLNRKICAVAAASLSLVGMVACGSSNSSAVPVVPPAVASGYTVPITNTSCATGTIVMNGICSGTTDLNSACSTSRGTLVQDSTGQNLCKFTYIPSTFSYFEAKPLFGSTQNLYMGAPSSVGVYTGIMVNPGDTVKVTSAYLSAISISGHSDLMMGLNDQVIDAEVTKSLLAKQYGQLRIGVSTPSTKAGMHLQVELSHCQSATAAFACP